MKLKTELEGVKITLEGDAEDIASIIVKMKPLSSIGSSAAYLYTPESLQAASGAMGHQIITRSSRGSNDPEK